MTFGEKLQSLRRKAGMSQDTLAEKLDVSRQAISKWERDETMPETEKLIRIAHLFDASLDELLLDREEPESQPEPRPEPQPRPVYRPNYGAQFRRHGYKLGYILMAVGGLICAFSLLMRLIWPAFSGSVIGNSMDFMSDFTSGAMSGFGPFSDVEIMIEGGGELSADEEQALLDAIRGDSAGMGNLWNGQIDRMETLAQSAVNAQANLFLIGLLPGGILLAAGAFIVVKGKKYARQTPDGNLTT